MFERPGFRKGLEKKLNPYQVLEKCEFETLPIQVLKSRREEKKVAA